MFKSKHNCKADPLLKMIKKLRAGPGFLWAKVFGEKYSLKPDSVVYDQQVCAAELAKESIPVIFSLLDSESGRLTVDRMLEVFSVAVPYLKVYGVPDNLVPNIYKFHNATDLLLYRDAECGKGLSSSDLTYRLSSELERLVEYLRIPFGGSEIGLTNVDVLMLPMFHPEIRRLVLPKFSARQYADAVESAFKEINARVKKFSQDDSVRDGVSMMLKVFSSDDPIVKLADNGDPSGWDIQRGYMFMFAGGMSAIRNPKAHENIYITKDDALRKLAFASMLMYKLDEAEKYN